MRIAQDLNTAQKHADTVEELDLTGQDLVEIPDFVWKMKRLRVLNLSRNRLNPDLLKLGKLPQLDSLNLSDIGMTALPPELFALESLQVLSINSNDLHTLPEELAELRGLRVLRAMNCKLTTWPERLCDFPLLESLILANNSIRRLPGAIRGLQNLKELLLHDNRLEALPSELALIPGLKFLRISENDLDDFIGPEGGRAVQIFFEQFPKEELSLLQRQVFLEILTQNFVELVNRGPDLLLPALSTENVAVRDRASEALYMAMNDPFEADKPGSICLLGQFDRIKKSQVRRELEALGIGVTAKPMEKNCVVIVGRLPGKRLEDGLARGCKVGVEGHLEDFLARQKGRYLETGKTGSNAMGQNILQMLRSGNYESIQLALVLMESGGLPADALSDLVGIALFAPKNMSLPSLKFLENAAPKRIHRFVERVNRPLAHVESDYGRDMRVVLEQVVRHPELDGLALLRQALRYYAIKNDDFGYAQILALPDSLQAELLSAKMTHGSMDLYGMGLTRFPAALADLTGLSNLNLARNHLMELPQEIGRMKDLQFLSLSENHLNSLPESFYDIKALGTLQLDGNRFHTLSDELGRMKELRNLVLMGNPLEDLPESFAETAKLEYLNLAQTFKDGVPQLLSGISSLIALNLEDCGIKDLNDWRPEWPLMESLALPHNPLKEIPDWVGQLPRIRVLDLSHTRATRLPESLAGSEMLEYLGLPLAWNLNWEQCKAVIGNLPLLKRVYYDRTAAPERISFLEKGLRHIRFEGYNPKK